MSGDFVGCHGVGCSGIQPVRLLTLHGTGQPLHESVLHGGGKAALRSQCGTL